MEIGCKLKRARNEKGLTQEQAAELLAVSRQTISNWENNKSYPDIISVIRMSDIYAVSLDHLLKEEKTVKQFIKEYFGTSEQGRISEKIMTVRVVRSVVVMIFCLFAMSLTA